MNEAYDSGALWQKSRLFLNHAMDVEEFRTFDERALWASLALELLAKAALARVSPLLVAAPNEEGSNLLVAAGLTQGKGGFNSVTASTLFTRCAKAFRPFDVAEAKGISRARNDYLHGGAAVFSTIPEEAWWPRYWAQAAILINAQDRDIDELVGPDRVAIVEDYLARNKRNIEHRVEMLIARAAQRLKQYRDGVLPAKLFSEWNKTFDHGVSLSYSAIEKCPACGEEGEVEGDIVESSDVQYAQVNDDEWDVWANTTVLSDLFSCSTCKLVLDGSDLLAVAGISMEFVVVEDVGDMIEPEYGND
ncbi:MULTISPECIES: hypothetical protein [Actinoalloteichus]|uniref:Uncharacterized protein n=1 Tax=Actinoalloteichus fjordicus TaxID=1612552 RepID=A0AAC9PV04_9PSEU|nr:MULTISPECIES: hypothetical protein [Actinoalloteichus]APU17783.1 hypothetical protein UA74_28950 [Actinoalloteichus fjordicus]APU23862.1 hypothetical protein UA75_29485 [Actinoalloteichus sp. GBA129-24]